jgi:putative pyruvate formate lyase activating enzyme
MVARSSLRDLISPCRLCPRECGADRLGGATGWCGVGERAIVASAGPHFGEEPPLVGVGGSGTIFFAGCNLDCAYCQNSDISHELAGVEAGPEVVADLMLRIQRTGCENVNFVTPTHVAHVVGEATEIARGRGFARPVVYNCGGYEAVETLRRLAGLVDIYMPDFKYASDEAGLRYSGVPNYPTVAEAALREMHGQVGPLTTDARGVASRGVLVRHLVLPGDIARSHAVIETVARVAPRTAINVMAQYRPCFRAGMHPGLCERPSLARIRELRSTAERLGLWNVDH